MACYTPDVMIMPIPTIDPQKYVDRLYDDEALRKNLEGNTAAIWFHAAGQHLRQCARENGDMEQAYQLCRDVLKLVNAGVTQDSLPKTN